ncbi:hypothetical protein C7I84_07505 [Mesorhizobium ephedrae]|uniref:Uncharacterized protein n=1 Tax=Kumtagia ephedrae TaxID=2116701 RepID=A0A2P7SJC8_9HYPH|nr:hypothetical protein C7I84_07505 [Mesorhizobium ephedrae]
MSMMHLRRRLRCGQIRATAAGYNRAPSRPPLSCRTSPPRGGRSAFTAASFLPPPPVRHPDNR